MQIIVIRMRDVNDPKAETETRISTAKKRKGAEEQLTHYAQVYGLPWSVIRDSDTAVMKGIEHSFVVLTGALDTGCLNNTPLEQMYRVKKG